MTTMILVLVVLAVFLPGCALAQPYGSQYGRPYGNGAGISTSDVLCGAIGVGGGLGTAKATKSAGWGVLVGAAGALVCKAITGAWETRDYHVIHDQPYPVQHHQAGVVTIPSSVFVPDGYEARQIVTQNNTKGIIFVRTPQGMHPVEPGGNVMFYEHVSTGAGGAFYAVHAMATVSVPGGYQSRWAHAFTSNNGTLTYTAEFKDFMWDNRIVPAFAAERHELLPKPAVYQPPRVGTPPISDK